MDTSIKNERFAEAYGGGKTQHKKYEFRDYHKKDLERLLVLVQNLTDIDWEFTTGERGEVLTVRDLDKEDIIFTHYNSAAAGLNLYLIGYNHGRDDQIRI